MSLTWRKTGDWPKHDNEIAYLPSGDYYLVESDGEGKDWYVRRYAKMPPPMLPGGSPPVLNIRSIQDTVTLGKHLKSIGEAKKLAEQNAAKASEPMSDMAAARTDGYNDGAVNSDASIDNATEELRDEKYPEKLIEQQVAKQAKAYLEDLREDMALPFAKQQSLSQFFTHDESSGKAVPRTKDGRESLIDAYFDGWRSGFYKRLSARIEAMRQDRETYGMERSKRGAAELSPVAMEPEHGACEDTCKGCGGLSSYVEQVQSALVERGAGSCVAHRQEQQVRPRSSQGRHVAGQRGGDDHRAVGFGSDQLHAPVSARGDARRGVRRRHGRRQARHRGTVQVLRGGTAGGGQAGGPRRFAAEATIHSTSGKYVLRPVQGKVLVLGPSGQHVGIFDDQAEAERAIKRDECSGASESRAEDYNSRVAGLRAAQAQGWTHVLLPASDYSYLLLKKFGSSG